MGPGAWPGLRPSGSGSVASATGSHTAPRGTPTPTLSLARGTGCTQLLGHPANWDRVLCHLEPMGAAGTLRVAQGQRRSQATVPSCVQGHPLTHVEAKPAGWQEPPFPGRSPTSTRPGGEQGSACGAPNRLRVEAWAVPHGCWCMCPEMACSVCRGCGQHLSVARWDGWWGGKITRAEVRAAVTAGQGGTEASERCRGRVHVPAACNYSAGCRSPSTRASPSPGAPFPGTSEQVPLPAGLVPICRGA